MTIKDSNLTINVKDLDKSVSFYKSIGLIEKNRWGNHYAQMTAPGLVIGLHPGNNISQNSGSGNTSIGFSTDNIEEVHLQLIQLSIPSQTREEEGGHFLHFNDPDGTALYFIKPKW